MQTKVAIIGGGVVGILTAYFLSKKGFAVEIFEKKIGVAGGASLDNGSQISFSHIYPIYFQSRGLKTVFKSKQKFDSVLKSSEVTKSLLELQKEIEALLGREDNKNLIVAVPTQGLSGNHVKIGAISCGFDWDAGLVLLHPEKPLTTVSLLRCDYSPE